MSAVVFEIDSSLSKVDVGFQLNYSIGDHLVKQLAGRFPSEIFILPGSAQDLEFGLDLQKEGKTILDTFSLRAMKNAYQKVSLETGKVLIKRLEVPDFRTALEVKFSGLPVEHSLSQWPYIQLVGNPNGPQIGNSYFVNYFHIRILNDRPTQTFYFSNSYYYESVDYMGAGISKFIAGGGSLWVNRSPLALALWKIHDTREFALYENSQNKVNPGDFIFRGWGPTSLVLMTEKKYSIEYFNDDGTTLSVDDIIP